jgi:hypothetical protein
VTPGDRRSFVRKTLVLVTVLLVGACGGDDGADVADEPTEAPGDTTQAPGGDVGATAVWRVDDADLPVEAATSFTALVTRLECNGGETDPGVGLEPVMARPECVVSGVYDLAGNTHELLDSCVVTAVPQEDPCVVQESAYDGHPQGDMICPRMGTVDRSNASGAIGFRCCAD